MSCVLPISSKDEMHAQSNSKTLIAKAKVQGFIRPGKCTIKNDWAILSPRDHSVKKYEASK